MTRTITLFLFLALFVACKGDDANEEHAAHAGSPLPLPALSEDARVFFVSPADGAVVTGPLVDGKVDVKFEMGAKDVAVDPAGEIKDGSGHHHILLGVDGVEQGTPVPTDDKHVHFGKAQTEATLPLSPGKHRISLQFADGAHRSYGPRLTSAIEITVEAAREPEEGDDSAEDSDAPTEE